jgi:acetoin utilization protein AcuB
MKVQDFMKRTLVCVAPTDSLRTAYDLMKDREVRHLLVVIESSVLVGLISERDVLLWASCDDGVISVPDVDVANVMTLDLVTCRPKHQLRDVANVMLERRIDAIPVTDSADEVLGIITTADFLDLFVSRRRDEVGLQREIPFNFTTNRFGVESRASAPKMNLRVQMRNE